MNLLTSFLRNAALATALALLLINFGRAETTNTQAATAPSATLSATPGTKIVLFPPTNAPAESATEHHPSMTFNFGDDDDDKSNAKSRSKAPESPFEEIMDDIVPIWGILASFGTPVLVVFIIFYFRHRRRQDNLTLAREFLNKGVPVPPQLLDSRGGGFNSDLTPLAPAPGLALYDERKGIKYIFIGLGIMIAFHFYNDHATYWAWGVIPLIIGCGYLVSGRLGRQREKEAAAFRSNPPTGPSAQ